MKEKPVIKSIPVSQLLVDSQNPRLPDIQETQHDAIRAMAKAQGDKIIALAHHLVENGPSPSNLPIVMRSSSDVEMYEVLDGNRRVTAVKLLETPSLAQGLLQESGLRRLKELSAKFEKNSIGALDCVVVSDRDAADAWMTLTHRGQQEGAGLVEWDGQVGARYDERKGRKHTNASALRVLDFVRDHGAISGVTRQRIEEGKFPITSLSRLVNTPYVRTKLGIEVRDQSVRTNYPRAQVLKGLTRVVEDLGKGAITVTDIKKQEQRIKYIEGFDEHDLPEAGSALKSTYPIGLDPNESEAGARVAKSRHEGKVTNRSCLIPSNCKLEITHARIHKIYSELKRLNADEFPNAAAVMLRVFIELSLDHYIPGILGWDEQKMNNSSLAQKLMGAANYLENSKIMTKKQLMPVKKAATGQPILASSVTTMNAYVHNLHLSPIASELKTVWDDLQPFIIKLWTV